VRRVGFRELTRSSGWGILDGCLEVVLERNPALDDGWSPGYYKRLSANGFGRDPKAAKAL
jgi:hypothetical protein